MLAFVFVVALLVSVALVSDALTLKARYVMDNPAFLSFVPSLDPSNTDVASHDLLITKFSEAETGSVYSIPNVQTVFENSVAPTSKRTLGQGFTWPNIAEVVPTGIFSPDEMAVLCGGSKTCQLLLVPDGFLTPGHKTGGLRLQPINTDNAMPFYSVSPIETNWFYHKAHWVDLDLDGKPDLIAARCMIDALGRSTGQLIWLKHPNDANKVNSAWEMTILTSGPDVMTLPIDNNDGNLSIFAAQFFSAKLSLSIISKGNTPKLQSFRILDDSLGAADDLHLCDVDGDGESELVVTTHEGGSGGFVYAYEMPTDLKDNTFPWKRITLASGFIVTRPGMNQASPGFVYPVSYLNASMGQLASNRPYFVVAGDGSQGVHIIVPKGEKGYDYESFKVLEIGGTVGTVSVEDFDHDGTMEMAVPNYDDGYIEFYTF